MCSALCYLITLEIKAAEAEDTTTLQRLDAEIQKVITLGLTAEQTYRAYRLQVLGL